jgi:hypothetical protein
MNWFLIEETEKTKLSLKYTVGVGEWKHRFVGQLEEATIRLQYNQTVINLCSVLKCPSKLRLDENGNKL